MPIYESAIWPRKDRQLFNAVDVLQNLEVRSQETVSNV